LGLVVVSGNSGLLSAAQELRLGDKVLIRSTTTTNKKARRFSACMGEEEEGSFLPYIFLGINSTF